MSKVFVNVALILDGFMDPESMTMSSASTGLSYCQIREQRGLPPGDRCGDT